jgi:hypothetical protein
MPRKEYQSKQQPNALKTQSEHKPKKRWSTGGRGRSGSDDNYNDSSFASLSVEEIAPVTHNHQRSLSSLGNSFRKSIRSIRKTKCSTQDRKQEYDWDDDDESAGSFLSDDDLFAALKTQSDHKPKKRWSTTRGRSGSDDDYNNSSCASLSIEEFEPVTHSHQSSLSSLGSSFRKSVGSILKIKRSTDSSTGGREFDGDESILSAGGNDDAIDQGKLMMILCKELEITCDDEDE